MSASFDSVSQSATQFGVQPILELARPAIMGVLNITPDSFSDGGALFRDNQPAREQILARVQQMLDEGADIIDVGGESTRPGAAPVSEQEELDRVVPVVEMIRQHCNAPISVDTSTARVMTESVAVGAGMINDVRALRREGALQAAAATAVPICLMHMAGEPDSMQQNPSYTDVVTEVRQFLLDRVAACERVGIDRSRLILDPGFGFGKTLEHNLCLFRGLETLAACGFPLLVGVSRKSMIGAMLNRTLDQRLHGSVALALMAVQRGASIVRVHDVAATRDALKVWSIIEEVTAKAVRRRNR